MLRASCGVKWLICACVMVPGEMRVLCACTCTLSLLDDPLRLTRSILMSVIIMLVDVGELM